MRTKEYAVVYARYSSHNQSEQSIEGQLAAAHKYASDKGYEIIKEYCDRAKTGTNDNREEFQNMLRDCAKKQFSVIIVWKVDRFGRNREEITFNKYTAKKHGVRVEYIAENISDGPEGVILESVLEGMAEYFSLQLSQNVKRGLLESAKKRQVIGGHMPLGYKMGEDRTYVIDDEQAEIVKTIFKKYAEGMTLFELMEWLNQHGYRTRNGSLFTKNSLPRLLTNEKYIGVYTFKDVIRDEHGIPAIIEKDLFERVQNMLAINKRRPVKHWSYSDYSLTGKIYCGLCGSPMVGKSGYGKSGGKYSYYVCSNQLKKECTKKPVRKDDIELLVFGKISLLLSNEEFFDRLVNTIWEYYNKQDSDQKELEYLQSRLESVEKAIKNIIKSIENGMPYDLVKTRIEELEAEKRTIATELAKRKLEYDVRLTKDRIVFYLEQFKNMKLTNEKVTRSFINSIIVSDYETTIALNYSADDSFVDLKNTSAEFEYVCDSRGRGTVCELKIYKNVAIIKL